MGQIVLGQFFNFPWRDVLLVAIECAELEVLWLLTAFLIGILILRKEYGSFLIVFRRSRAWLSQKLFWSELRRDIAWVSLSAFVTVLASYFIFRGIIGNGAGTHGLIVRSLHSLNWWPQTEKIYLTGSYWQYLFVLSLLIMGDFAKYWSHRLMHRIPILWHYHKVHHTSVTLTPLSVNRSHPTMIFLYSWIMSLAGSLIGVPLLYFFSFPIQPANLEFFLTVILSIYLATLQLHHSHIWLSFGKPLNKIFVSPAMHQIHHSNNPNDYGKNFGFIFSFWDILFGSARLPKGKENLAFGLLPQESAPTDEARSLSTG